MCGRLDLSSFVGCTSLTIIRELNHIIVASHHMFTLVNQLTWVDMREECYNSICFKTLVFMILQFIKLTKPNCLKNTLKFNLF